MNSLRSCAVIMVVMAVACVTTAIPVLAAGVLAPDLKIEKVFELSGEVADLAQSPTGELWVLERAGTVRVFVAGVERASLTIPVSTTCDSGLLDVAFAPDYPISGSAFVSLVDPAGQVQVNRLTRGAAELSLGAAIVSVGSTVSGCRVGGGLEIGSDGMLYVSVGDLGIPTDAQDDGSLAGKVLRSALDGSVPPDNASGSLVWAKGFRDGGDLAINPVTDGGAGTVYVIDAGEGTTVYDEVNAVAAGGNYGWDAVSGPDPLFDDPLFHDQSLAPVAAAVVSGAVLGADAEGSLVFACTEVDDIGQALLTGEAMDTLDRKVTLYDPDGDRDGTADAGCPTEFNALTQGDDGWIYGANRGANPGIWRIWKDLPGPREVSAAGSPFPLTVDRLGGDLVIGWEDLGSLDVGRPVNHGDQREETYQIWEGSLPLAAGYADLAPLAGTDGTPDPTGAARRTATIPLPTDSRYYLVTAQGDNMEGSLGPSRPAAPDYCDAIGWGTTSGSCAADWPHPLTDWNPASPTFGQPITLSDFRGKVIRMDISAVNCIYCDQQSQNFFLLDRELRDRDLVIITVLMSSFSPWTPIAPANCEATVGAWAIAHRENNPVVCATDLLIPNQYDSGTCGTPQNFYVDQGHYLYQYVCGGELSYATQYSRVIDYVNPETCE